MDLKIDYATLVDDDLRQLAAEATVELDKRRTLAEAPARIAALYQRIEDAGGDTKQAEATITAERAVLATEAARARNTDADTGLAHDKDPKEVENRLTALENQ
jgi:hypothetical protein